jgi:hypothetical protein
MIAILRRLKKHCFLSLQPSTCIPNTVYSDLIFTLWANVSDNFFLVCPSSGNGWEAMFPGINNVLTTTFLSLLWPLGYQVSYKILSLVIYVIYIYMTQPAPLF